MNRQLTHRGIQNIFFSLLVLALLVFPSPARALEKIELPPLDDFITQVMNGEADDLRGIYVPGVLADAIVPQPADQPAYVSSQTDTLTQFEMASRFGTIGLLAHNYLAGKDFFLLEEGRPLYLIYGDGRAESYILKEFMRYQALEPQSVTSDFTDLASGEKISASQLFLKVFNRPGDVVLQTCIYADGNASWGRLFIVAVPFGQNAPISMPHRLELQ